MKLPVIHRLLTCLLILVLACRTEAQENPNEFFQDVRTHLDIPHLSDAPVIRLLHTDAGIAAVSPKGVFLRSSNVWQPADAAHPWSAAAVDGKQIMWLASPSALKLPNGTMMPLPDALRRDSIICILPADGKVYAGTTGGLVIWNGAWTIVPELKGARVNGLAMDADQQVWAATLSGLWRQWNGHWLNLDESLMAVGNQRQYFSVAIGANGSDVLFGSAFSVGCVSRSGDHWVKRGPDGLPFGPATTIRLVGGDMWLGTRRGAIRKDSAWHYYLGKRWLPHDKVNDILEVSPGVVWIATDQGVSQIGRVRTSLEAKAEMYEEVIGKRHDRRGLINISKLKTPGDLTTSYTENEDNDGLWTACYLAAECYRYACTQSVASKVLAVRTFEALERLEKVTGISGYPARSYAAANDHVEESRSPHAKQWHYSRDRKWKWLDDTSSDEITGHLFSLALFHDLVADAAQQRRAQQLISRIVTNIIDHNFQLIDYDGKPTRWGIWTPDSLNLSPNWMYERGLNSLQILSFLTTAYHYTHEKKFADTKRDLIEKHHYADNAVTAKIYGPFETSHSDDILNFFPYYGLLRYEEDPAWRALFVKSLERSWLAVRADRMPVWNTIASALLGRNCDLDIARRELQTYPVDLIDWDMINSHRWDITTDPLVDRFGDAQAVAPLPSAESSVSRWNTNPKRLVSGNGGMTEETGTYFLFAYWMGRYYGFWK